MKIRLIVLAAFFGLSCKSDVIRDKPISFSQWRVDETIRYVNTRYDRNITSLEMLPVMIVSHFTAMEPFDVSFNYLNNEAMESARSQLKTAGGANIAVQFLVDKNGDIYRLMPENHIGRHVIGLNRHAIGIENVGKNEQSLTAAQVEANALIVRRMSAKFPIKYLIGHSEYREFENTPLWEEKDKTYRTEKVDPGESFMKALRERVKDLGLKSRYDGSEVVSRLEFILADYHKRGLFNGVALVADSDSIIFEKAYGRADNALNRELRVTDRMYIASAAKTVTALAVLQLIREGKLKLTTSVAPYFANLTHLLAQVQVQHLLYHSSGLEDYYRLKPQHHWQSNAEAIQTLAEQKAPLHAPGKKFHYANSNYILLAELVEKITKEPFKNYVRRKIFEPAMMCDTFFRSEISDFDSVGALTEKSEEFRYKFLTHGAGGIFSTAGDLWRFDRWIAREGFSPALTSKTQPIPEKLAHYGAGIYQAANKEALYHDGNFNGYHSMNWLNLRTGAGIILLANSYTKSLKEITYEIDRVRSGLTTRPIE